MGTIPVIDNLTARRLFLYAHGLGEPATGPSKGQDLLDLITRLGFVQIDSINMVERAHHMILHARRHSYRPENLRPLLEIDRTLFEHWTHDAAVIPTEFYQHWKLRFERDAVLLEKRWKNWRRDGFEKQFQTVLEQINDTGPCGSGDVGVGEARSSGGWWDWHPSKTALEFLWRTGRLTVTRRESFRKIYDLTERVIPACDLDPTCSPSDTIDWACRAALDRLGFATPKEIAAFWDKLTLTEAKEWCVEALASGELMEVHITGADKKLYPSYMWAKRFETLDPPAAPSAIRILSPFDPALRDRKRTERLFGFHYRIEIFVPAAKRQYGYYVFPVLQGERLIGRIDMKCDRPAGCLKVTAFWPEKGVRMGKARLKQLNSSLERTARFAGSKSVEYCKDWLRA